MKVKLVVEEKHALEAILEYANRKKWLPELPETEEYKIIFTGYYGRAEFKIWNSKKEVWNSKKEVIPNALEDPDQM